jgi:hypothetical protein
MSCALDASRDRAFGTGRGHASHSGAEHAPFVLLTAEAARPHACLVLVVERLLHAPRLLKSAQKHEIQTLKRFFSFSSSVSLEVPACTERPCRWYRTRSRFTV